MNNRSARLACGTILSVALSLIAFQGTRVSAQGRDDKDKGSGTPIHLQMTVDGMNANLPTPILSFALGATNSASADAGSGSGAGKASFTTLDVTKLLDGLSVPLLKAVATGAHIKDVKIEIFEGGSAVPFATYTFTDVLATSDVLGSTLNKVSEQVAFSYSRIASHVTVNGMTFTSCFDLKSNSSC
jgi:type VI protein secretion system component Hcp